METRKPAGIAQYGVGVRASSGDGLSKARRGVPLADRGARSRRLSPGRPRRVHGQRSRCRPRPSPGRWHPPRGPGRSSRAGSARHHGRIRPALAEPSSSGRRGPAGSQEWVIAVDMGVEVVPAASFSRRYVSQIVESSSIMNTAEPVRRPPPTPARGIIRLTRRAGAVPQRKLRRNVARSRPPRPRTERFPRCRRPAGVRVIDAVADSEGRHDERQDLVAGVFAPPPPDGRAVRRNVFRPRGGARVAGISSPASAARWSRSKAPPMVVS